MGRRRGAGGVGVLDRGPADASDLPSASVSEAAEPNEADSVASDPLSESRDDREDERAGMVAGL